MPKPTMKLLLTRDAVADSGTVLDHAGVYLLLWATPITGSSCEANAPELELVPICAKEAAVSMRIDIEDNILGSATTSLTRAALGLMLRERLMLQILPADSETGFRLLSEERLTSWILANTVLGYAQAEGLSSKDLYEAFASGDVNVDGSSLDEGALAEGLSRIQEVELCSRRIRT